MFKQTVSVSTKSNGYVNPFRNSPFSEEKIYLIKCRDGYVNPFRNSPFNKEKTKKKDRKTFKEVSMNDFLNMSDDIRYGKMKDNIMVIGGNNYGQSK